MNGAGELGRGQRTPIGRLLAVRGGEWAPLLLSGAFFFLVLFGYFLLRPVREAMGVERSMRDLRWLFGVTCVVSLGVALTFGGVVSRMDRRRFIALAYRGVIACLLVFATLRFGLGDGVQLWAGYVFYVWLSVVNLFMTSVFWAFMADVWRLEQGKRLYAGIGVGGTLGALAASWLTSGSAVWAGELVLRGVGGAFEPGMLKAAVAMLGEVDRVLTTPWVLMVAAAGMFECAVRVMRVLDGRSSHAGDDDVVRHERRAVGGSWVEGARAVARSPYLLGVGGYLVLMAVSSTLIYFAQAKIVSGAEDELESRIPLFGQLDMWTQVATLVVQVFVTGRLLRLAGVGVTLSVLPVVTVLGFGALAVAGSRPGVEAWQVFAVFAVFNALHRATRYAVARPARETLFSVVPEAEKYKAKPIVDVFLYRGGDVAGTGVEVALSAAGLAIAGAAFAAAPMGVLWVLLSVWLAKSQRVRAGVQAENDDTKPGAEPEGAMG